MYSLCQLFPLVIQQVKYVDDTGLAYVMQRYREVHDLIHVVNGMGIGYGIQQSHSCYLYFTDF